MDINFYATESTLTFDRYAYTSKGRLRDAIRKDYFAKIMKEELERIRAYTLVVGDDEHTCDDEDEFTVRAIYGYYDSKKQQHSDKWYLTKTAAVAAYGGADDDGFISDVTLYLGHLPGSRTGEYPYSARLMRNERGLYCRLTVNPDQEGFSAAGKLCFPDRSWDVTKEGLYHVEIVRDMGNYAFIKGKVDDYTFDELGLVLDHLWAKEAPLDTYIQKVSGSMFGTFYAYANNSCWESTVVQREGCARAKMYHIDDPSYRQEMEASIGKLNAELDSRGTNKPTRTELGVIFQKAVMGVEPGDSPVYEMLNDVSEEQLEEMFEHIEWKRSLGDLFIESAFGDIHSKEELYALFTKSGYLCERVNGKGIGPRNGKKVKGYWFLEDPDKNAPDVVLAAFDEGILSVYALDGIRAIGIDEDAVLELLTFSRADLDAISEYVRAVNEKADAAIDEKLATGKLKLE